MRSHLSLQVRDVPRSVAFYQRVFAASPQKQTPTYAKFDLAEPALNFALVAGGTPSQVGHLGIEALTAEEFAALRHRLAQAGIAVREEPGSTCCYALQDKLWFEDPDGNAWEVFQVHAQLPVPETTGQEEAAPVPGTQEAGGASCCT